MSRILFLSGLLLFPLLLLGETRYTVNIAVYKDHTTLDKRLKKLPPKLRSTIKVTKKKGHYYASTFPTTDTKVLKKLLSMYKKEFADAHITAVSKPRNSFFKER